MPNTPNFSIPYPALTDPPNGAAQMQALATAADAMGTGLDSRLDTLEAAGPYVVHTPATTNSPTWNSPTEVRVLTANTFTTVGNARYRPTAKFAMQIGIGATGAVTAGFRLRYRMGGAAPTATDPLIRATPARGDVNTAVYYFEFSGSFIAPSSGPCVVALFGCNPSGDTSVCGLYGSTATTGNGLSTNEIEILRIKG